MELYYKYQPVTWYIGVIEADSEAITRFIQPLYIPDVGSIRHEEGSVDEGLAAVEPFGPLKFLLIETKDARTCLFSSSFSGAVELPTSYAAEKLKVSSYYVCNVPNTISADHRSGSWGARMIVFRKPDNPINKEPTFGVELVNDCGKWHFYRFGRTQLFEDEKAYKALRKPNRFTEEMLVKYCQELGIPVYDRNWYSNKWIIIEGKPRPNEHGISYQEARIMLRIKQNEQAV